MKNRKYAEIVQKSGAIFTSAVLEYLAAELLELAGNACLDKKKTRIIPRHILLAIKNDEELNKVISNVVISEGGAKPNILPELLPEKTKSKMIEGAS